MKKVLIITYSFPPLNNIASRRYADISKYLESYDWEPYILTTNSTGPIDIPIPQSNIYRVSSHPQKGSQVKEESSGGGIKAEIMNLKRDIGFNSRIIDRTYYNWYRQIKKMDLNSLKKQNFDMIIASFGPGAALFIGRFLSKKLGVPWVADFRDLGALYRDNSFKQNAIFSKIDLMIEKRILQSASMIITVSKGLKDVLERQYNKPTDVIFNGWEKQLNENSSLTFERKEPYIYYAGRFYPHQMESIHVLLRAIKGSDLNFKIRSLGPRYLNEEIIEYAKSIGVLTKVKLLDPAEPAIVDLESTNAKINLVVEDLDKLYEWKKGTLTGKLLNLLIKSPPILAIARDDSEIDTVLKETGKGLLCSTEREVQEFLYNLDSNEYVPDEKKIKYYSKEKQAEKLARLLNVVDKKTL